ncbi:MAG TPA: OmpA family protein [Polyangiaceae bacterium]|nr:OmpA family protein [Polyangiaceae bacterium]
MKAAAVVGLSVVTLLAGCSQGPKLRGKIAGLSDIVEQAERNGAIRCAPRELAVAKSQLEFASLELDQGFISKANAHLWKAEPNAHAAYFLSPPQYCAERGFVEVARPAPGDRDGDGYLDPKDKCPDQPETYQGFEDDDGCPDDPDTDGDGITDSKDSCVLEPEDKDNYLDDDGCPEADNDLDTLVDTGDKCPLEAEDPDGFEDADGCPDPDNDKDTVPDTKDQCPNEIGSTTQEPLGCPTKPALVVVTDCEVKITQQIHFEFNKDKIRPESFPVLDAVVEALQKNQAIKIEVQGHTDNKGAAAYNKNLSDRRAKSVMKYLLEHGVELSRLTSHGYGFERPLVDNSTEQNRALNRRVQFVRTEGVKEGCPKPSGG